MKGLHGWIIPVVDAGPQSELGECTGLPHQSVEEMPLQDGDLLTGLTPLDFTEPVRSQQLRDDI